MICSFENFITAVVSATPRAKFNHARQTSALRSLELGISSPMTKATFSSILRRYSHNKT
jgi:hypothetical protein